MPWKEENISFMAALFYKDFYITIYIREKRKGNNIHIDLAYMR